MRSGNRKAAAAAAATRGMWIPKTYIRVDLHFHRQSESLDAQDQRHRQAARTDHSAEWYPGKAHPPR